MKRVCVVCRIGVMSAAALCLMAVAGCDVDVKDPGTLPSVDVDATPGDAPDVDVRGPDVDVQSKEKKVTVPDVDVDVKSKEDTITVPDINVDVPAENENE